MKKGHYLQQILFSPIPCALLHCDLVTLPLRGGAVPSTWVWVDQFLLGPVENGGGDHSWVL